MLFNILNKTKKNHLLAISLISLFPLSVFFGSGIINIQIILIDLIFLYEIFKNKKLSYLNNKFFYLFCLIWFYLLINLFFSIDLENSFSRSFGFCRFIILVFALKYYIFDENEDYKKYIFSIWSISFLIISLDLIFELIVGENILGFKTYMPGRLSGFFNQELKIGYIYSFLGIIILSYLYIKLKNTKLSKFIFYIIFFTILFISLAIGERANFIKLFITFFIFLFLFENNNFKLKSYLILSFLTITIISLLSLEENNQYKYRFWGMFLKPVLTNPINYLNNSNYGEHYMAAYNVFKKNKIFGIGLKNYRIEVSSGEYGKNTSTHPHEKHLELLSELGLIGYLIFISFFIYSIVHGLRLFIKNRNLYQLSGLLFIFVNLIPLIPSGSLFTTYTAVFFWFSFSFMINSKK
tara:strand:- start:4504 stop:5730 length:1227 start_codon:yes stop_codon:yes gene_type:complete